MEITVELFDGFENDTVFWTFQVNHHGYLDIVICGKVMDTLYEHGEIKTMEALSSKVKELLLLWNIQEERVENYL